MMMSYLLGLILTVEYLRCVYRVIGIGPKRDEPSCRRSGSEFIWRLTAKFRYEPVLNVCSGMMINETSSWVSRSPLYTNTLSWVSRSPLYTNTFPCIVDSATNSRRHHEKIAAELAVVNANLQILSEEMAELNTSVHVYQDQMYETKTNFLFVNCRKNNEENIFYWIWKQYWIFYCLNKNIWNKITKC